MVLIDSMTTNAEQVTWLAQAMVAKFNDWPGPQHMRALFCTRYKPADGLEASFPSGHHITIEMEQRSLQAHGEVKHLPAPEELPRLLPGKVS